MRRSRRHPGRYELLACAFGGHTLIGTGAAHVSASDRSFVREFDAVRWHRCLRCDSWIVRPVPDAPTRDTVESREEIELPLRGPLLRDRIVLRLISVDRAIHVLIFGALATALFTFASHSTALHHDYVNIMNDLSDGGPGASQARGILGHFSHVFSYTPAHLIRLGLIVAGYACLEAVEMVGLWKGRRWTEYLTSVAIAAFIPLEVYELSHGVSAWKVVAFVLNVAVLVYLLYAKRLFGLRGGFAAEEARRQRLSGWSGFDGATPVSDQQPVALQGQ